MDLSNTTIEELRAQIDEKKLPRHVAIIMDGNGRWAKQKGRPRIFGHRHGVTSVREVTEIAAQIGIEYLTLYAFSTENWNRPPTEVEALMILLVQTLNKEIDTLDKNNIKLQAIGDISKLPSSTRKALLRGIENTKNNTRMTLVLALNYSAKWEILKATRLLADQVKRGEFSSDEITSEVFSGALSTAGLPDPELLVRTSGETRLSNFLLWQLAYAEFYFTSVLWPDYRQKEFLKSIIDYQQRERRFGKISEQLTP